MNLALYFHTLRHLRAIQFVERLHRRFRKIKPHIDNILPVRKLNAAWISTHIAESRMVGEREFLFLNKRGQLQCPADWNNDAQEKLWLYNLHYFEDLVAVDAKHRVAWHCALINDWILDNPPLQGNGWEAYPQSLRIVNWIKWFLNGQVPQAHWLQSLIQQAHVLSQDLEYHLLGNHLFANAKALVFAGLYFTGGQAEKWLAKGLSIIDGELKEQVLSDGGNFELSPMYHSIMLHDVLDLLNIAQTYSHPSVDSQQLLWREIAATMLGWMDTMVHPDDEIPFFNDAAIGVAPNPKKLRNYAQSLRINPVARGKKSRSGNITACQLIGSGYIRVDMDECVALLDCARIGPDYIPGHAHADNLSFEMSLYGQRLFVNSGTSCYGLGDERLRQRGTATHNTVEVDGKNSSEVWGGFRVARRAYPSSPVVEMNNGVSISCSHNGYQRLKGKVVHHRCWHFKDRELQVVDRLVGAFSEAKVYFHLHPDIKVETDSDNRRDNHSYILTLASGKQTRIQFEKAVETELAVSTWHPEFGKSVENYCLVAKTPSNLITATVAW